MAATNYTPIQLYYSTTASAVPLAANLAQGELAINITDGKLYYEDNAGVVQVIATKGAGTIGGTTTQIQYNNAGALAGNAAMTFNSGTSTTTLTTLNLTNALGATYGGTAQSAYTQGDVLYASATNTLAKLGIGTVNYILTSTGTVPQWVAPSSITVNTATNLAGGLGGSVPYQSAVDTTTFLAIGAANRVMTSSGTAPQWVTSLTGLTGVSSSSITNTGLTSTRLVYSSTAGLQTDSANLTFDGTTLSAAGFSTTGLSTLVKTVKIGDSSFSGTAVFAAATPAKLYIGTGTVTDATSAIGATNATGAISSLAITPIAATNTSVTYTNASTLYIAGAPSAGTNITITNPYSMYVAAGAAYFGGAVTVAGSLSLAAVTVTSLSDSGNLTFTGTGNRITGDFSNATFASRVVFQTSTVNGATQLSAIPNGTGTVSTLQLYNNSDIANSSRTNLAIISTETRLSSDITGTGTYLPMTFYTGGSERMRLDTSGKLGVGVSTINSGFTAQVNGNIGLGSPTRNQATTALIGVRTSNDPADDARSSVLFGTTAGAVSSDSYIAFNTNQYGVSGGERVRIDPAGNVGIGTTSPAANNRLTLSDTNSSKLTLTGGSTQNGMLFNVVSTSNQYYIGSGVNLLNSGDKGILIYDVTNGRAKFFVEDVTGETRTQATTFLSYYTGTTERMRIDSSGNVGIGTSSGTARLSVNGGTSTSQIRWEVNNAAFTQEVSTNAAANAYVYKSNDASYHVWKVSSSEAMRLDSSGNVLIGSATSAGNTLRYFDIYNTDSGASAGAIIRLVTSNAAASGNTTVDLVKYKTGGFILNNNDTNAAVFTAFGVGASERMRINARGDVGIGVVPSAWADFRALDIGSGSIVNYTGTTPGGTGIYTNVYFNGSGYIYKNTGAVTVFGANSDGTFTWYNAASGTAGASLTLTERMRIDSAGIVTMSAYGAGAATFSAAGVISSVSDETWKIKDGVPVDPDSMLKKLEPGYWYYNDEKKETFGVDRQLGFYAQNVNAAIGPEAAPTPEEGKPWGYYDRSVLAVTVMSLQKALATIESLTARITALEST